MENIQKPEDWNDLITGMLPDDADKYMRLRDIVSVKLSAYVTVGNDHFTSHGYDHVVRVLGHLSNILKDGMK